MSRCFNLYLSDINVNGLLVAESEVIRFHEDDGILFTIYNENMELHFYILVHDTFINTWKNIYVNNFYKFTCLKLGALEMISGKKIILLKTTPTSSYIEIKSCDVAKFEIPTRLKELISVPGLCAVKETINKQKSVLISYEGEVTNIRSFYGVYELDNKVIVYTAYNILRPTMSEITIGSKLLISNTHLLNTNNGNSLLVCCGLSSVKIIEGPPVQDICSIPVNTFVLKYRLSIYDLLWVEKVIKRMERKFCAIASFEDVLGEINSKLFENILNFFHSSKEKEILKKHFSLVEEYCSFPHKCFPFLEDQMPISKYIYDISDIVNEVSSKTQWIELSNQWSIAFSSHLESVVIGILYFSKDGFLYIEDESYKLQVLLDDECSSCSKEDNILHSFKCSDQALIVAIQDYIIIFEDILFKRKRCSLKYLKTSCCCIFHLASLHRYQKSIYNSFSKISSSQSLVTNDKISYRCFTHKNYFEYSAFSDSVSIHKIPQFIDHYFLVLGKVWSVQEVPVCSKVVGLFLPQTDSHKDKNQSIFNNTFNFYETEDDFEFADLISKLNCLSLENEPRLIYLCFEKSMNNILIPGYIYNIQAENFLMSNVASNYVNINRKIHSVSIKENMNILLSSKCLSYNYLNPVNYCGVKEILLNKNISHNSFIRAILIDKFYKESVKSLEQVKVEMKPQTVLCLLLRDIDSKDTIYAYIPLPLENIFGLLPGVILELYGFFCLSSQKGYLYLKPSLLFGVEVKYSALQSDHSQIRRSSVNSDTTTDEVHQKIKMYSSPLSCLTLQKCLCFIIKVISAELSLVCIKCLKYIEESCICGATYKMKTLISVLMDNGNKQFVCFAKDEEARKILKLERKEWQSLIEYVEQTLKSIKYCEKKNSTERVYIPIINQVFYAYCCSKSICRQMLMEFRVFPSSSLANDLYYAWCVNISNVPVKDYMMELYCKIKNIPSSFC